MLGILTERAPGTTEILARDCRPTMLVIHTGYWANYFARLGVTLSFLHDNELRLPEVVMPALCRQYLDTVTNQ